MLAAGTLTAVLLIVMVVAMTPRPSSSPVDDLHELVWSLQAGYHLNPTGHLLIDGERWENDGAADRYVPTPFGDSENGVVAC